MIRHLGSPKICYFKCCCEHVYHKILIISLGLSVSWYSENKQKVHVNGVTEDYGLFGKMWAALMETSKSW